MKYKTKVKADWEFRKRVAKFSGDSRPVTRTDVNNIVDSINMTLKPYGIVFNFNDRGDLVCEKDEIEKNFVAKGEVKQAIIDFAVWLSVQKGYENKTVMYEVQSYLKSLE